MNTRATVTWASGPCFDCSAWAGGPCHGEAANPRIHRAFTLIELLLTTALAAILLGGVLTITAALARDAARASASSKPHPDQAMKLLEWDVTNASTMRESDDGKTLVLVGQCVLDRDTLAPSGRLARVVYRVDPRTRQLTRAQQQLDDPVRIERWVELVASDVARLDVVTQSMVEKPDADGMAPVPARLMISLVRQSGTISSEVRAR